VLALKYFTVSFLHSGLGNLRLALSFDAPGRTGVLCGLDRIYLVLRRLDLSAHLGMRSCWLLSLDRSTRPGDGLVDGAVFNQRLRPLGLFAIGPAALFRAATPVKIIPQ
jgi:hypothetical protein